MAADRRESEDDSGLLYELHEKMREIVTGFNDTVSGRCAVCLEPFCSEDVDQKFTERPDLVRIDQCFHRFHLLCVHRDWFMQRNQEKDDYGCVISYKLPDSKMCPICRR